MQKFLIIILSVGMLFSCTKEDDMGTGNNGNNNNNGNNGTNNELVNPNLPTDNNIIDFQTTIGQADKSSSIFDMIASQDGNFFFRGNINNDEFVGKMNTNGDVIWKFLPNYNPRKIFINEDGNLLVISNRDKDNDGATDEVYLFLFDKNGGSPISQISWDNFENIRLNGISENIAVGRCQINGVIHPVVVEFSLNNNNILIKEDIHFYSNEVSHSFTDIKEEFVMGSKIIGSFDDVESVATYAGKLTSNYALDWFREIEIDNTFGTEPHDFLKVDNHLIICGQANIEEDQNPGGGGYWTAGFVASVSDNGTVEYAKLLNPSIKSDRLFSIFYHNNYVYTLGNHSGVFYTEEEKIFRNGWISKIVASTGDVISNKFIGNETYSTGLNTGIEINGKYYAGGFTEQTYDGTYYYSKGWLIEFDQF